jgi:signal transduction histidine kinase
LYGFQFIVDLPMNSTAAMAGALSQREGRAWSALPVALNRVSLAAGCIILICLLGYLDYLTGYEQSLLLFYLVPIALATWFGDLAFGFIFSALSLGAWVMSDVLAGIPSVRAWNLAMATAAYVVFTILLHKLRTVLRELDQRVRDRTVALQREIAERKRLDKEIAEVADRERLLLGQELHDGLCQHLTGTALTAQTLRERLAARSANEVAQADQVVRYLEQGIDMSRNLARGLFSPELEADGLMVALQGLAENMTERWGVRCSFESDRVVGVRNAKVATQLYRIAQEAVMNAIKHADADEINIALAEDGDELSLTVSDSGSGLSTDGEYEGLGLRLMAHGAALIGADFQARRGEAGGTVVSCRVNLNQETIHESEA